MCRQASSDWVNDNVSRLSAAVAFYTLLSIAPVIVIAVALAAVVYGRDAAEGRLASEIAGVAGPAAAKLIRMATNWRTAKMAATHKALLQLTLVRHRRLTTKPAMLPAPTIKVIATSISVKWPGYDICPTEKKQTDEVHQHQPDDEAWQ